MALNGKVAPIDTLRAWRGLAAGLAVTALTACGAGPAGAPPGPGASERIPATAQAPSSGIAAVPKPAGGAAAAAAGWDELVAAGKQEGKVSVLVPPGDSYRALYDAFTAEYGIQTDLSAGNGQADQVPRVDRERKSGQYLWDVVIHSPTALFNGYNKMGALDPLRPAFILPEITDDSKWLDGFNGGWSDSAQTSVYLFVTYAEWAAWINRDSIPEGQLSNFDQLWDPRWKGKIAMQDPRVPSSSVAKMGAILQYKGEEKLRAFFRDQQPVMTQDRRQLAEWVIRGQYPIGIGVEQIQLVSLAQQGVKVNVQPLRDSDSAAATRAMGTASVGLFNRAPHPNAARTLINWILSRAGQTTYSRLIEINSRRLDVPVASADTAVDPKRNYLDLAHEATWPINEKVLAIAKEMLN